LLLLVLIVFCKGGETQQVNALHFFIIAIHMVNIYC